MINKNYICKIVLLSLILLSVNAVIDRTKPINGNCVPGYSLDIDDLGDSICRNCSDQLAGCYSCTFSSPGVFNTCDKLWTEIDGFPYVQFTDSDALFCGETINFCDISFNDEFNPTLDYAIHSCSSYDAQLHVYQSNQFNQEYSDKIQNICLACENNSLFIDTTSEYPEEICNPCTENQVYIKQYNANTQLIEEKTCVDCQSQSYRDYYIPNLDDYTQECVPECPNSHDIAILNETKTHLKLICFEDFCNDQYNNFWSDKFQGTISYCADNQAECDLKQNEGYQFISSFYNEEYQTVLYDQCVKCEGELIYFNNMGYHRCLEPCPEGQLRAFQLEDPNDITTQSLQCIECSTYLYEEKYQNNEVLTQQCHMECPLGQTIKATLIQDEYNITTQQIECVQCPTGCNSCFYVKNLENSYIFQQLFSEQDPNDYNIQCTDCGTNSYWDAFQNSCLNYPQYAVKCNDITFREKLHQFGDCECEAGRYYDAYQKQCVLKVQNADICYNLINSDLVRTQHYRSLPQFYFNQDFYIYQFNDPWSSIDQYYKSGHQNQTLNPYYDINQINYQEGIDTYNSYRFIDDIYYASESMYYRFNFIQDEQLSADEIVYLQNPYGQIGPDGYPLPPQSTPAAGEEYESSTINYGGDYIIDLDNEKSAKEQKLILQYTKPMYSILMSYQEWQYFNNQDYEKQFKNYSDTEQDLSDDRYYDYYDYYDTEMGKISQFYKNKITELPEQFEQINLHPIHIGEIDLSTNNLQCLCTNGHFWNFMEKQCAVLPANSVECKYDQIYITSSQQDFDGEFEPFIYGQVQCSCEDGYFFNNETETCVQMDAGSTMCVNVPNFKINEDNTTFSITEYNNYCICDNGYYNKKGQCYQCPTGCSECKYISLPELQFQGIHCSTCETQQIWDHNTQQCINQPSQCTSSYFNFLTMEVQCRSCLFQQFLPKNQCCPEGCAECHIQNSQIQCTKCTDARRFNKPEANCEDDGESIQQYTTNTTNQSEQQDGETDGEAVQTGPITTSCWEGLNGLTQGVITQSVTSNAGIYQISLLYSNGFQLDLSCYEQKVRIGNEEILTFITNNNTGLVFNVDSNNLEQDFTGCNTDSEGATHCKVQLIIYWNSIEQHQYSFYLYSNLLTHEITFNSFDRIDEVGIDISNPLNIQKELKFCTDFTCSEFLETSVFKRNVEFYFQLSLTEPANQSKILEHYKLDLGGFQVPITNESINASIPGKIIYRVTIPLALGEVSMKVIVRLNEPAGGRRRNLESSDYGLDEQVIVYIMSPEQFQEYQAQQMLIQEQEKQQELLRLEQEKEEKKQEQAEKEQINQENTILVALITSLLSVFVSGLIGFAIYKYISYRKLKQVRPISGRNQVSPISSFNEEDQSVVRADASHNKLNSVNTQNFTTMQQPTQQDNTYVRNNKNVKLEPLNHQSKNNISQNSQVPNFNDISQV